MGRCMIVSSEIVLEDTVELIDCVVVKEALGIGHGIRPGPRTAGMFTGQSLSI